MSPSPRVESGPVGTDSGFSGGSGGSYSRGGIWPDSSGSNAQGYGGPMGTQKPKSPAVMKVERDLDVFIESISTAEQRVRRGDNGTETQDLIRNLREMRPKIADLSIKLNAAGEYETADKATAAGKRLNIFFEEILAGGTGRQGNTAGIFDDFNTISSQRQPQAGFDQFNAFSSPQPVTTAPPKQATADFWSQNATDAPPNAPQMPKATTSRSFFDEVQTDPAPRGTPNSFFDTPHFSDPQKPPVQSTHKPVQEDINLLGLDDPVAPPKQPTPAPPQQSVSSPLGPSFDLLCMNVSRDPQQSQWMNPFATPTAPVMQTTAPNMLPLQQQQLLKMMQMNPLMQQQLMMNPLLYQQMMMNPAANLGLGLQMNAAMGGLPTLQQSPVFGTQNKVSFQEPSRSQLPEKRQYDPFNDLASDLI